MDIYIIEENVNNLNEEPDWRPVGMMYFRTVDVAKTYLKEYHQDYALGVTFLRIVKYNVKIPMEIIGGESCVPF